jgi:tetratricopeptide (TPR) repeat protein
MTPHDLLHELAAQHGRGDDISAVSEKIRQAADALMPALYWRAIALLSSSREVVSPSSDFDVPLAFAITARSEMILQWADALRVTPGADLLARVVGDLRRAISLDPALADAHLDLAVVAGRFQGDHATAAQELEAAVGLGYQHPAMGLLAALIREGAMPITPTTAVWSFRQLMLDLADHATSAVSSSLDSPQSGPGLRRLVDYVAKAEVLSASMTEDELLAVWADARALSYDAADYGLDLLRQVAEAQAASGREVRRFLDATVSAHVAFLLGAAFLDVAPPLNRLKAARRARAIVHDTTSTVDADLRADVLIAEAEALLKLDLNRANTAIPLYRQALRLKREAGDDAHIRRLTEILWSLIDHAVGRTLLGLHVSGAGRAIDLLATCCDAADDLDNPNRSLAVRLELGMAQRMVNQYADAEVNLIRVVENCSRPDIVAGAKFELACVFSETSRARQAARLQEELLDVTDVDLPQATLWSNYANSLLLLGRLKKAKDAFAHAWDLLGNESDPAPLELARIRTLQADLEQRLGNDGRAAGLLIEAGQHELLAAGVPGLHLLLIRARVQLALGQLKETLETVSQADAIRRLLLQSGPTYATWESVLAYWNPLDALAVRALLLASEEDATERAFLLAEAAKGRITSWLRADLMPEGAVAALDLERQREALTGAQTWVGKRPGRRIVSLFATDDGLAMFTLDSSGLAAEWVDEFAYPSFRDRHIDKWEELVGLATRKGDPDEYERAARATTRLLNRVGELLAKASRLLDGGSDLVVVPHRLFRGIPLLHSRIPDGRRLSQIYESVVVAPTLAGFSPAPASPSTTQMRAVADADGSLPLARAEAVLAVGSERCAVGRDATGRALLDGLRGPGLLLIGLHGTFDEKAPMASKIATADGQLMLADLLTESGIATAAIILGVCEAGRSRRSISDEPWGFGSLLLSEAVRTVVAPAWQVDDLSSCLIITRMVESHRTGTSLASACAESATWLRTVTAKAACARVEELARILQDAGQIEVSSQLTRQASWLTEAPPGSRPFASALDWAAFQTFSTAGGP